ncbi:LacI family DNA-binding transcriptional regulator [Kaistia terrae]|jgi:DNA-binding LacI/PurR family transcriptional regulator|uniref:LacI family DNA-binding transcriptional regulator n=1 Tax=Kaistia terrae TaxID=537017 RepID=A0ABW0PWE1_9HYPH|nr:LacI family DNA-binding transcriptional regulator [Kaistia terrae]MCX5581618.1 LacI family DNA-binding transcriptional regulator [Kaistia terrae]
MKRAIKLSDVAKAAGVSQGTASNAFNRPEIVRPEVRERIEAAARELGYAGPDPKGRLLRAGKVNAIGVVTTSPLGYFFEDPYARAIMTSISEACDVHGAGISLVSAANEEKLAWNIQSAIVDGFILFCIEGGARLVELTRERRLPFIALQLEGLDETISAIGIDEFSSARTAGRHIMALGHRDVAILALELTEGHIGPVSETEVDAALYSTTRNRIRGYQAAMVEFGVDAATAPIFETDHTSASVEAALAELFGSDRPPTALLCMSDRVGLIALDWLRARKISVPGDVSVIGFDGVPDGEISNPPLTTVAQPIAAMGRQAADMILGGMNEPHREQLPVDLIVRASTAAPG